MSLIRPISGWCRRAVLSLRWHTWRQLGLPLRALGALDEQLTCWTAQRSRCGAPDECTGLSAQKGAELHELASPPVHLLATRAHLLGQLGLWQDARSQLAQVIALDADNPAHAFNLGFVCAQMGDAEAAIQAFRSCLSRAPRMDQAWFGLGAALLAQGDFAGAEAAWVKQVSMQPLCPDGYSQLVRLFIQRGNAAAARNWLDRLRAFEPRRALALEPQLARLSVAEPSSLTDCPA